MAGPMKGRSKFSSLTVKLFRRTNTVGPVSNDRPAMTCGHLSARSHAESKRRNFGPPRVQNLVHKLPYPVSLCHGFPRVLQHQDGLQRSGQGANGALTPTSSTKNGLGSSANASLPRSRSACIT